MCIGKQCSGPALGERTAGGGGGGSGDRGGAARVPAPAAGPLGAGWHAHAPPRRDLLIYRVQGPSAHASERTAQIQSFTCRHLVLVVVHRHSAAV